MLGACLYPTVCAGCGQELTEDNNKLYDWNNDDEC